jgi:hypothetical protein
MDSQCVRNIADDGIAVGVKDGDVRSMRDVDAA